LLIEQEILQTDAVEKTLNLEVADAGNFQAARDRIQAEVAELDIEIARLVDLAASGSTPSWTDSRIGSAGRGSFRPRPSILTAGTGPR